MQKTVYTESTRIFPSPQLLPIQDNYKLHATIRFYCLAAVVAANSIINDEKRRPIISQNSAASRQNDWPDVDWKGTHKIEEGRVGSGGGGVDSR